MIFFPNILYNNINNKIDYIINFKTKDILLYFIIKDIIITY